VKTCGLVLMGLGVLTLLFANASGRASSSAYTDQSIGSAFMAVVSILMLIIGFIIWIAGPRRDKDDNIRPLL